MSDAHIVKWARVMRLACDLALFVVPALVIAELARIGGDPAGYLVPGSLSVSDDVTQTQRWLALSAGLVPLAILMWTILQMRRLFALFAQGSVLTRTVAGQIRRIGQGFLVLALAPFVVIPVQSVLLSWANPVGERSISVSFSSNMLGFAVVSGLLILIGWAMAQAADVAAENESFV